MTINNSVHWSGTIIIQGDIVISRSGRLVIDPGTKIMFSPHVDKRQSGRDKTKSEIIVEGMLIARGQISNKIIFSSNSNEPRMGDWYGISIANPEQISIFEHVLIEYAYNGISIKKSNPQISNSQIRFNYNSGITAEVKAAPKIIGNIISENGYAGIICRLGASPILSDNLITLNQIGIVNFSMSQPNMGSLQKGDNYNIGQNRLFDNQEYNIFNHSTRDIMAENNFWGTNNRQELIATIHDYANDPKYGKITIDPLLSGVRSLQDLMLVSQNANETLNEGSASAPGQTATDQQAGITVEQNLLAENRANNQSNEEEVSNNAIVSGEQAPSTVEEIINNTDEELRDSSLAINIGDEKAIYSEEQPGIEEKKETEKPAIDYNQVFLDAFLDERKEITRKVAPVIRDYRRGLGAHGKVLVRVVIATDGTVETAQILRGLNIYYDDLALEAARKFEFKPGTISGKAVRFSTTLFFEF